MPEPEKETEKKAVTSVEIAMEKRKRFRGQEVMGGKKEKIGLRGPYKANENFNKKTKVVRGDYFSVTYLSRHLM